MKRRGFTLVEVVASVVLLSLLAGAVLVVLSATTRDAQRLSRQTEADARVLPETAWDLLRKDLVEGRAFVQGVYVDRGQTFAIWGVVDRSLYRQHGDSAELVAFGVDRIELRVDDRLASVSIDIDGRRETRRVVLR